MEAIILEDALALNPGDVPACGQRWLLVSREPRFVAGVEAILLPLGIELQVCEYDVEAALRFAHQRYDAVLADATMGLGDLRQLATALQRQRSSLNVPLMALASAYDQALVDVATDAGYDDVLVWPIPNRLLLRKINRIGEFTRLGNELALVRCVLDQVEAINGTAHFEWRLQPMALHNAVGLEQVLGLDKPCRQLPARKFLARVHPDDRLDLLRGAIQAIRRSRPLRIEFRVVIEGGLTRWLRLVSDFVPAPAGHSVRVMGLLQDVTEARTSQQRIWQLANHDSLTGLPNRRQFLQQAQQLLAQSRARSGTAMILCVYVEGLREVNETWGFAAGDELLMGMASRLQEPVRSLSSTPQYADALLGRPLDAALAGRLDGSHLVLFIPLWSGADPQRLAARAREFMQQPMVVAGRTYHPQVSLGSAQSGIDGDTVDELITRAEDVIRRPDTAGSAGVLTATAGVVSITAARPGIERDLHRALTQGEFVLHYQPQIDARNGELLGAEALIRWQRGHQLLNPASFLDAAETIGLMANIGEWAVAQACYQLAAWEDEGLVLPKVSVNIAAVHLERTSLTQMVLAALDEHGLRADRLELEVSESGVLRKRYELLEPMQLLAGAGIRLAVDNCGTGYAAWPYLSSLPLSTLKIDRSYIGGIESSRESRAIAETIIGMARGLRLGVIAEGVESVQQLRLLLAMGCPQMQGFYFARPMDASALHGFVRQLPGLACSSEKAEVIRTARQPSVSVGSFDQAVA